MNTETEKITRNTRYDSLSTLFVAMFITTSAINLIATRAFSNLSNFMSFFYALTGAGILVSHFLQFGVHRLTIRLKLFVTLSVLLFCYLLTVLLADTSLSFSFFIVFVFLPLIIPSIVDVNIKNLIRVIFIIPSIGIFWSSSFLVVAGINVISMGECYALLIPIIAALTYLMIYYKKDSVKEKVLLLPSIIINFFYFVVIVLYGSRGPILCGVLCFVFLLVFGNQWDKNQSKKKWKILLFTLIIAVFVLFFWEIIQYVSLLANRSGVNIRAIEKLYRLKRSSNIWNGRNDLYQIASQGILESPIWGHGISTFLSNTGIIYPHNFILQVLYDGGLILGLLLFVPMLRGCFKIVRYGGIDDLAIFSVLFFSSVPGALFSGDCWKNGCLWLLLGVVLSGKIQMYQKSKSNTKNSFVNKQ